MGKNINIVDNKKRILYLTNIPSPYRVDFFNELGKKVDLTVLFERHNASDREERWINSNYKNFKGICLNSIKLGKEASITLKTLSYLSHKKYDVIIIGGYSTPTAMIAITYMMVKKINFILNVDGGFRKKERKIKYLMKKFFISKAKHYLSTGRETNKYLKYYGAKEDRIFIYPFTSLKEKDLQLKYVDDSQKITLKKELRIKEEKVILSIGQFIHRKGLDILLKASKDLNKNIGIYIIGGKPTKEYLNLKEKLKLENVHFLDFKSKKELTKYYKAADIFVHPTREDIWGLVINEAMAYGLPVITTNKCLAGLELLKNGENGYIVANNNSSELKNKIKKLLDDHIIREKIAKNNLSKIRNYTIEKMVDRHIKILKTIIKIDKEY